MTGELLVAFVLFSFANSITPGPNNVMLLASGVNHGFVRTLPHIAGISIGCVVMMVLVGFGLGQLLAESPRFYAVLHYASALYLLVLAWRIARSGMMPSGTARRPPMRFLQAASFQWVNPKAWVMVMGAVTTYAPHDDFMRNVCLLALLLAVVNVPSISLWAGCGVFMRRFLDKPRRIQAFNYGMALLLVLSLYPILE